MAERVQIVLEAQDMTSGIIRGIAGQFGVLGNVVSDASDAFSRVTGFMDLMNNAAKDSSISAADLENSYAEAGASMARLGETIAVLVVSVIKDAIKVTDEYNAAVRDLSLVSGESADSTSRFIQVLDDYELTAQDAMTASKALKEKGLSPTIDTIATLADEFKKIKDPAERMAFVQENLGRGGAKWVNVLNQESDALRQAAASIDPWLVKTDEQIKKAEISRLALDNLGDSWAAFQNRIGDAKNNLIFANEASQRAYEILKEQGVAINGATNRTQEYRDALKQAETELLSNAEASIAYNDSLEEQKVKAEEAAAALAELSQSNADIINGAIAATEENENYRAKQDEIIAKIAELQAKKDGYYSWETDKIQAAQSQIDELNQKYDENAEAFIEAQNKKLAMMAIEKIAMEDGVAGYSDAEYQKARAILETTDVATAAAFEQEQAQQKLVQGLLDAGVSGEEFGSILKQVGADGVVSMDEVAKALNNIPSEKNITIGITTNGAIPTYSETNTPAPGGVRRRNASGGMYMIPSSWGNEGLPIGNSDTASGGELISITPRGQNPNKEIVEAIMGTRIDYDELARVLIMASQRGAK